MHTHFYRNRIWCISEVAWPAFLFSHFSHPETLIRLACCIGACLERGGFADPHTSRAERTTSCPVQSERKKRLSSVVQRGAMPIQTSQAGALALDWKSSARDRDGGRWPIDQRSYEFCYFFKSRAWIKLCIIFTTYHNTQWPKKYSAQHTIVWDRVTEKSGFFRHMIVCCWNRVKSND